MEIRDNGASFLPLLLGLEVNNAVWDCEILSESPFVTRAEAGRYGGREVVVDVGWIKMWKRLKKFPSLPCVECSCEVLTWAKNPELLEFVISMMEYDVVAQVFLELTDEASCKARLLFEVCCVKSPLVLKERLQVLTERGRESLQPEPFCEGCLECEKVSGFAGEESAVHIGVQENAKM